ncbi:MAG: hypothetical protein RLZZ324_1006 [Candidatus Parcubacteria bacterium]|jgi:GTP-binding protein
MPAEFMKSCTNVAHLPQSSKPQVALLGRSNAGKSSLINHLAGMKHLARTSSAPGLTRTINVYDLKDGSLLIDLPGYGFTTSKPREGEEFSALISHYLSAAEHLRLVLVIVDARHGLLKNDLDALEQLEGADIPFAIVFNKVDLLAPTKADAALKALRKEYEGIRFIPHSVDSSKGLGEIREVINEVVRQEKAR